LKKEKGVEGRKGAAVKWGTGGKKEAMGPGNFLAGAGEGEGGRASVFRHWEKGKGASGKSRQKNIAENDDMGNERNRGSKGGGERGRARGSASTRRWENLEKGILRVQEQWHKPSMRLLKKKRKGDENLRSCKTTPQRSCRAKNKIRKKGSRFIIGQRH